MMTLSEYERQRLENIRRNQEILASLNIPDLDTKPVTSGGSIKLHPRRRAMAAKQHPAEPTRRSQRIQEQILEQIEGKARRKRPKEALPLPPSPKKEPRPVIGPLPLAPQVGASEEFVALMQDLKEDGRTRRGRGAWALALPHAIVKAMASRVYSIAVHPSTDKTVVAVGGKNGELAFWDATDVADACRQGPPIADFENANDLVPLNGRLSSYREFEPRIFAFQSHARNDGGSVSNLCYRSGTQLLSTSYDGSIRCMDVNKAVFDDICRGDDPINGLGGCRDVWWFSHSSGIVSRIDLRSASRPATFHLHTVKIGTVSIHDDLLCTASNDRSVAIWDIRALKPEDGRPVQTFACGRAVTSAYIHPASPSLVLSTCYDDLLRIHNLRATEDGQATHTIRHNNQTGRWITPFKAVWDPKSTLASSAFVCSSMDRCIDIYGMDTRLAISHEQVRSPMLTSQPAVCCVHPGADIVCAGNASGKMILYTRCIA